MVSKPFIKMARRTNNMHGWVNFPVNDADYTSSNEGGMFVRLVVEGVENFMVCSGGGNSFVVDEVLSGTDNNSAHPFHEFHDGRYGWVCPDYLCVITLGSTGWSGWNDEAGHYWKCSYDDLTSDGKALYQHILALYPEGKLTLQTWLDT